MRQKLRRSERRVRHVFRHGRVRAVFWLGAVMVGLLATVFILGARQAEQWFALGVRQWPWLPLALTPLGLGRNAR